MADRTLITIVIPMYNEARRLPASLQKIEAYCSSTLQNGYEILVVDDGSKDESRQIVGDLAKQNPRLRLTGYTENRGKGFAVKTGVEEARGQYVLFTDADLSTPIEELEKFLPYLKDGTPVVIGTRRGAGSRIVKHQPLWRESMGKVFTWLSNKVLSLHASDFTCGFKAFETEHARKIFRNQQIPRWAFDSELLFLANRYGFRIVEVPVRWMDSPETKVRILRDAVSSFLALWQIRWNALRGKYENGNLRATKSN
jgi:dolichyl-phosphate beta-glucosyltransferase